MLTTKNTMSTWTNIFFYFYLFYLFALQHTELHVDNLNVQYIVTARVNNGEWLR